MLKFDKYPKFASKTKILTIHTSHPKFPIWLWFTATTFPWQSFFWTNLLQKGFLVFLQLGEIEQKKKVQDALMTKISLWLIVLRTFAPNALYSKVRILFLTKNQSSCCSRLKSCIFCERGKSSWPKCNLTQTVIKNEGEQMWGNRRSYFIVRNIHEGGAFPIPKHHVYKVRGDVGREGRGMEDWRVESE